LGVFLLSEESTPRVQESEEMKDKEVRKELKKALEGKETYIRIRFVCPACGKELDSVKEAFIHLYAHQNKGNQLSEIDPMVKQVTEELLCGEPTGKKYLKMRVELMGKEEITVKDPEELHEVIQMQASESRISAPIVVWGLVEKLTKLVTLGVCTFSCTHAGIEGQPSNTLLLVCAALIAYSIVFYRLEKAGEAESFPFDMRFAGYVIVSSAVAYVLGLVVGKLI
jgi:hypothetical protein